MDVLPPADKSATTAITNYMIYLAREERVKLLKLDLRFLVLDFHSSP